MKKDNLKKDNLKNAVIIVDSMVEFDQLTVARKAITDLISPELEKIDKKRKAAKERVEKCVKATGSAQEAVDLANMATPSPPAKSDNALYKVVERRRKWLSTILKAKYTDYTFEAPPRHGAIVCTFVGTPEHREAVELLNAVTRLTELGYTMPVIEEAKLEAVIVEGRPTSHTVQPISNSIYDEAFTSIMARVEGINNAKLVTGQEKAA